MKGLRQTAGGSSEEWQDQGSLGVADLFVVREQASSRETADECKREAQGKGSEENVTESRNGRRGLNQTTVAETTTIRR